MIWTILASVLGLLVIAYLAGYLLPAPFRAEAAAELPHPVATVWDAVADYQRAPIASHMAKGIEKLPDQNGLPCWREDLGSSAVTVRTVQSDAPARVVRELEDSVVPMRARWEIELADTGAGTRVTAVQTGRVDRGTWHVPIFRIVLALGAGRAGMRAYMRRLTSNLGSAA